jgi:hypothetical protein
MQSRLHQLRIVVSFALQSPPPVVHRSSSGHRSNSDCRGVARLPCVRYHSGWDCGILFLTSKDVAAKKDECEQF